MGLTGASQHRSQPMRAPSTFPPRGRLRLSHAPRCATAVAAPLMLVWEPLLSVGQKRAGRGPGTARSVPAAAAAVGGTNL